MRICREVVHLLIRESRDKFTVDDLIWGYTTTTGRPNEWDLLTDQALYGDEQTGANPAAPEVAQHLIEQFGVCAGLPCDGRLGLLFTKSFHAGKTPDSSMRTITRLGEVTRQLSQNGRLQVVDWGWPTGLWAPVLGCLYELRPQRLQLILEPPQRSASPQQQWRDAHFSFGLANPVKGIVGGGFGKPWRRFLYVSEWPA